MGATVCLRCILHRPFFLDLFNPFTAMLAASSLGKRPIKVLNLKSLRLFSPFASARERTSIKMHNIEGRFVIGSSNILFACVYVCTFQARNCAGRGSEGVKKNPCLSVSVKAMKDLVLDPLNLLTEMKLGVKIAWGTRVLYVPIVWVTPFSLVNTR